MGFASSKQIPFVSAPLFLLCQGYSVEAIVCIFPQHLPIRRFERVRFLPRYPALRDRVTTRIDRSIVQTETADIGTSQRLPPLERACRGIDGNYVRLRG